MEGTIWLIKQRSALRGAPNPYAADDGMDNIEAAERPDAMSVIEQPDGQMRWAEV